MLKSKSKSKLILLLLACTCLKTNASMHDSVHWPHNGDRVTKSHYEFVEMPTDTTVWDFSHAIETGDSHDMRWMNFGDSLLVRIERGSQYTYTMQGDSLLWRSQENALLGVRDSVAPMLLCGKMPSLGDSIASPYYFRGKYSGNNAVDLKGMHSLTFMSLGTLILPNDTVCDVLRVREITDGVMKVSANAAMAPISIDESGLLQHTVVTDRWYAPDCRYEIAENVSSIYRKADDVVQESYATFLCTPDVQELALDKLTPPKQQPLLANKGNKSGSTPGNGISLTDRISVTVNDYGINVIVTGNGNGSTTAINSDVSLLLSDISGRVWASQQGNTATGMWNTNVDTSSLPSGNYILYISAGEETTNERIQIK